MKKRIELLAPGGDVDSIKAAVVAGANAIYCGLHKFNARNRAANIVIEELNGILRYAHQNHCQVYLALNIILVDSDLPELIRLLNNLANTSLDAVIVQDLGLFFLLSEHFPGLKIHASTQLTTHNSGQIKFLRELTARRANLSRELSVHEISALTRASHDLDLTTEVFVHGSYCLSFSGICYFSSVHGGNSGNRGRCSQPCRDQYVTTPQGMDFPLNLKDNSAFDDLQILSEAGVDALKIEGRIKQFPYVYTVTHAWSQQLQSFYDQTPPAHDRGELNKVFNREYSNSYLQGDIHRDMFIDHPRNQSAKQLSERHGGSTGAQTTEPVEEQSFDEIAAHRASIQGLIQDVSVARAPLTIRMAGSSGTPLEVTVDTPDTSFVILSEVCLAPQTSNGAAQSLTHELFLEKLNALNKTEYFIQRLELENLQAGLFVPFRELTSIRDKIFFVLRGSNEAVAPIEVPPLKHHANAIAKPTLSVLISSPEDVPLCRETSADFYFQLPSCLGNQFDELTNLFAQHNALTPWFPPVIIGEDYTAAIELLRRIQPRRILTNNTGIAYEAWAAGIPWTAGPQLNVANSFSLTCLKEKFGCAGAFLSNELNLDQISRIKAPGDFGLHYRIFHPMLLLSSRQCLFHQVIGCDKNHIDEACLSQCERSSSITNMKQTSLHLRKTKGNYARLYHETHFLNTDIVTDLPGLFTSFLVDLRDVKTATRVEIDKSSRDRGAARHRRVTSRPPPTDPDMRNYTHPAPLVTPSLRGGGTSGR